MIVNMSATDGCHSLAPITSLATTASATHGSTDISMASQGHSSTESNTAAMSGHDFNFLKRKLDLQDVHSQQHPHQQTANLLDDYPTDNNNWKKRHVINELTTNFGVNTFVDDYSVPTTSTATTLSVPSDISFTNTSAFINDLFTYDANLIVPVPANLISHTDLHTDPTIMTTPSGLCLNSVPFGQQNDEDGANWQATDLLELDHRYNAGLQTEINQLNPTIALKPAQEDNLREAEQQQRRLEQGQRQGASYDTAQQQQQEQHHQQQQQQQQQQQLQQHQQQQGEFVVPQKQMPRLQTGSFSAGKFRPPQNDTETDQFEDKNLSWLLNFKFDEFPHLSPDVGGSSTQQRNNSKNSPSTLTTPTSHKVQTSPSSSANTSSTSNSSPSIQNERSRSPKSSSSKASKKFEELVMEVTSELDSPETTAAATAAIENVNNSEDSSVKAPKKPPFTYTELIEYALEDKGELTVSGIYQWISDRFPYYKSNDDRWKNSVRHNLSINPHFRKGHKAPQGAGHLWTISSGDSAENVLAWEHKKQRLDLFFKMESMNRERLQQHKLQQQHHQNHQQQQQQATNCQHERCVYDEAAAAAATITQEMSSQQQQQQTLSSLNDSGSHQHHHQHHHQHPQCHDDPHMGSHYSDLLNDDDLRKTAGQILNGIHREVEVQSVNSIISTYQDVLLDNDFLNPINKDINLMHSQSSSHPSSHYYVTEIDPLELGIQMSHQVSGVEEEVLFNDEFNLNYFYNPGNDIVA